MLSGWFDKRREKNIDCGLIFISFPIHFFSFQLFEWWRKILAILLAGTSNIGVSLVSLAMAVNRDFRLATMVTDRTDRRAKSFRSRGIPQHEANKTEFVRTNNKLTTTRKSFFGNSSCRQTLWLSLQKFFWTKS